MKTIPAVKIAIALALGIYLGDRLDTFEPFLIWGATALFIFLGFWGLWRNWGDVAVYMGILCLGFLFGTSTWGILNKIENLPADPVLMGGKVVSQVYQNNERQVVIFRSDWISEDGWRRQSFAGNLRLIVPADDGRIIPGSRLVLYGKTQPYPIKRNPGGRDLRREFARQGIVGWIKPEKIASVEIAKTSLAAQIRSRITDVLRSVLPPRQAGLLTGMILGQKSDLPEDVRDNFARSGLYHLLAVSGLHVGYLFALLILLVRPLILNLRLRRLVLLIGLWGYVILTGANPPTLRAALMISLIMLSFEVRRFPRHWNLWGGAALVILLFAPQQLFTPGFQLSFAAMAGILVAADASHRVRLSAPIYASNSLKVRKFFENHLAMPLLFSLCAVAFTAPILILHFGGFAPIAILLNLLAVPLAGAIFGVAWITILLKGMFHLSIDLLSGALELGLKGLEYLTAVGAHLPGNSYGDYGGVIAAIVFLIVLIGILRASNWRRVVLWISTGLALLFVLPVFQSQAHLRIEFLDVGKGDATLMRFPGGTNLLVDCGSETTAKFELIPSLRRRGINRISALLLTHFQEDHAGGAVEVLESLKVGRLLVNSLSPDNELGRSVIAAARRMNVPIRKLALGDTISILKGVGCRVLWPPQSSGGDDNQESIVLKVSYGEVDFLLTGDVGWKTERILFNAGDYLQSEILKVAHHGSRYSSRRFFLNRVRPRIALISCSAGNSYGHPTNRVVSDLEGMGCLIHRTDLQQAAVFASNGRDVWPIKWR